MNSRLIKSVLAESAFDPKTPSPTLRAILEADSPTYYLNRAKELVAEASRDATRTDENLTLAITLLAIVKIKAKNG